MKLIIFLIGYLVAFILALCAWKIWLNIEKQEDPNFKIDKDDLGLIFITSAVASMFSWFSTFFILIWILILKNKDKMLIFFNSKKSCIDIINEKK